MKRFYEAYADAGVKLSAVLRQMRWTNNTTLTTCVKSETVSHLLSWSHYFEILHKDDLLEISFYERTKATQLKLSPVMREIEGKEEEV